MLTWEDLALQPLTAFVSLCVDRVGSFRVPFAKVQVPSPSQMRRVQAGLVGDLLQGVRMLGHKRWNALNGCEWHVNGINGICMNYVYD